MKWLNKRSDKVLKGHCSKRANPCLYFSLAAPAASAGQGIYIQHHVAKYNKLNEVKVVITEVAVIVEERW